MHSGRFEGEGLLDVVALRSGPTHDKPHHSSGTSYRGSSHTHSQQSLLPLALPLHAEACLVVRRTISTFQLHCAERYVAGCSHTGAWQPAEPPSTDTSFPYQHTGSERYPGPSQTRLTAEHDSPIPPTLDLTAEPLYLANCEWDHCQIMLDDTSPAGVMRHLREWHLAGDQKPFNKTRRGYCRWASGCSKQMAYASFGKHVSYVHLRHDIRCPLCNRDIGRAGLLPLHLEKYCRRATKQEQSIQ